MINEIVRDLIKELEPAAEDLVRPRQISSLSRTSDAENLSTRQCKQIQLCTDSMHMLLLHPWVEGHIYSYTYFTGHIYSYTYFTYVDEYWICNQKKFDPMQDFLCRLKIGRTFEHQVSNLTLECKNFTRLPYPTSSDSLLTRILRVCDPDHGPDLVEFIIYRPDKPIPVETAFKDLFNPCRCITPICAMKTSYEKVKMKYEKRRKSYPVEKTRRTSVPCLTAHNPERGKMFV